LQFRSEFFQVLAFDSIPVLRLLHHLHVVIAAGFTCSTVSAELIVPGIANSGLSTELQGRVLVEELNCVACHDAKSISDSSRKAPRLAAVGARVNPDYLRAFIAAPHEVKPGTLMPDVMGDRSEAERLEVAETITHFLVSLNNGEEFELQVPDAVAAERGERLFHAVGCVACHSPRDPAGVELLAETSVPLGALEKKYSHKSLREFLQRPHAVRPSGRMPDLRLPGNQLDDIAHYLLRNTRVPGHLAFTQWRGKVWEGLQGDVEKERAGQVDDFDLEKLGNVHHHSAIRYDGFLRINTAGNYTFHMTLNGGSLRMNGQTVVDLAPSDHRGTKALEAEAQLKAGWNAIELTYFHTGREAVLQFEMEGPGFPRQAIPADMLATSDQQIPVLRPLQSDPVLAAKGKLHFASLGCAQCHDDIPFPRKDYAPMAAMASLDPAKGCMAEAKANGAPRFGWSAEQTQLIATALPQVNTNTFTDHQMVDKTLAALNCIACHDRDGLGGISPERNAYFTGTAEALGDQGRLPPPLTHVGAKLTQSWLTEVLLRGGRQREYLNTRMPQFGEAQVGHLVELFGKVDSLETVTFPEITNIRESKDAGYEMMGATGLSCIACHDFNGQKSGGAGALELVNITERLQKNWFHLYMRQPSRFHPTVIMPSYWPGGQSIRKEVLGGNSDQQIEALWNYLSDGTRAKNPKGLSRQSLELRVADETVMCRGRGTASYRGIGVGYPERISLAFDSEEMAVRQLWKGEFANVDHGSFRPRGTDRIVFANGVPFHRLASMDDPWPYKGKTNYLFPQDHGYQYRGYFLNKEKRPTFLYRYGEIAVEDFFEDLLDEDGKAFFRRTMTFSAPTAQETFYFRAATGKAIAPDGIAWKIDQLNLHILGEPPAQIRNGEVKELLVPLTLPEGETVLQLEYHW
jgi:cytochrome c553